MVHGFAVTQPQYRWGRLAEPGSDFRGCASSGREGTLWLRLAVRYPLSAGRPRFCRPRKGLVHTAGRSSLRLAAWAACAVGSR